MRPLEASDGRRSGRAPSDSTEGRSSGAEVSPPPTGGVDFSFGRRAHGPLHDLNYRSLKFAPFFELKTNEPFATLSPEIDAVLRRATAFV